MGTFSEGFGGMTTISDAGGDVAALKRDNDNLQARVTMLENHAKKILEERDGLVRQQRETLAQLNGGDTDPRTCSEHPGHILVKLGWEFVVDLEHPPDVGEAYHLGLHWMDPEEKGTGTQSLMCLSMALGIVYRRLEAKTAERLLTPSWMERVGADD